MVKTSENMKFRGVKNSRYEPIYMKEANASNFIRKSFEEGGFIWFFKKV